MKKRFVMAGMTMALGVLLTGCHMKHEWQEATCTQPRTCTIGKETEGEPLGHVWKEADCTKPRTCMACGETEGEALEHSWQEADYFNPQICLVCGKTQGDKVQPSFETHGLSINTRVGETYDYVTRCSADESKTTVGKLTFSNYRRFDAATSELEGYEWRAVHMEIAFTDENAQNYGMRVRFSHENYYDTEAWDEVHDASDNSKLYTIHYNGQDYTKCQFMFDGTGFGGWVDGVNTWEGEAFAIVPIGYDGMVLCLRNAGLDWEEGEYIYDIADKDTIFFRMDDREVVEASTTAPAEDTELSTAEKIRAEREALDNAIAEGIPAEIQDMLSDELPVMVNLTTGYIDGVAVVLIRAARPEYIPDVANGVCEMIVEKVKESGYPLNTISISAYDTEEGRFAILQDTVTSWNTADGVSGVFYSAPDDVRIDNCTIQQLYDYYADNPELLDGEQTVEAIKEILSQNCQGLVYDDENSIFVFVEEDEIAVMARTYKDYLVPAIAERVVEAVYQVAGRSELPVGWINIYCADNGNDDSPDVNTMVYWRTDDMETGVFGSVPDTVYEELYTIEDMYEYYGDYYELIEKAMNGERVDAE
ncbi:MAG: hypothetical protein K2O34_10540 [Acetatifactor sp.]|nr:hypothetical protein [Acetatifactor sp.]